MERWLAPYVVPMPGIGTLFSSLHTHGDAIPSGVVRLGVHLLVCSYLGSQVSSVMEDVSMPGVGTSDGRAPNTKPSIPSDLSLLLLLLLFLASAKTTGTAARAESYPMLANRIPSRGTSPLLALLPAR